MLRATLLSIAFFAASAGYAAGSAKPLFNGENLDGWRGMGGPSSNWGVKDGVLFCNGKAGASWLATTREYSDFELSLEFKLPPNGNSGVFLRAPAKGAPWVDGLEIQLLDDYGEKWKNLKPDQFTGAIYAALAPSKRATKKAGEWQSMRILCVGRRCQVWVNQVAIVDADLDKLAKTHGKKVPGLKRTSGFIGLQNHGDPASFRKIDVREIGKTRDLFDGKSLAGWQGMKGPASNWSVKNATLFCNGTKGAEWLATQEEFADFELSLEFNLPENGNSGVFVRAPKNGNPWVTGMEIQLLDDYGEKWNELKPDQFTGAIYAALAPSKRATKPAGQWQTLKILCLGRRCQVWVNGTEVVDANLDQIAKKYGKKVPGLLRNSGMIGVQNHGDPVSFRKIRVREISAPKKIAKIRS
ncbi:MAG: DUF1080 domain-containing protein [Planctomycetota bacterium]